MRDVNKQHQQYLSEKENALSALRIRQVIMKQVSLKFQKDKSQTEKEIIEQITLENKGENSKYIKY